MWDRWVSIESNQWFKHAKQGWLRSVTWDKHGVAMHLALLTLVTLLTVLQSYIILPKVFCHVPGLCCKPLVQSARPAGEDMLPGMGTSISLLQPWAISCTSLSGCWLLLITVGTLVPKHTADVPTRLPWPSSWLMKWRRICVKIWICVCIILIHLAWDLVHEWPETFRFIWKTHLASEKCHPECKVFRHCKHSTTRISVPVIFGTEESLSAFRPAKTHQKITRSWLVPCWLLQVSEVLMGYF